MSFIDDKSRYTWLRLLKSKDEAFKAFMQWKALVENRQGMKIKKLLADNGPEFCKEEFNQFYADEGIGRHHTVRMTPQQNGVAERVNQTLLERVRCMLSNAGLRRRYWSEAVMAACYIINRGPYSGIDFKIPFEI